MAYEDPNQSQQEGNPIAFTPDEHFFGPEPFEAAALKRREEVTADLPARESPRDRATNGHSVEAPRKRKTESNGDSMEVDAETESRDSPAPDPVDGDGDVSMGAEEVPQEPTLATGTSVGVQISPAKAADLAPDTACLDLPDHVVNIAWRPQDSTMLVAAGESVCSLWKLSLSSPPVQKTILDVKDASESYISAVAWNGSGSKLAVASMRHMNASISMYNEEGNVADLLPDLPRMISGLYWAEEAPLLAIVASDERSSELALWDDRRKPDVYPPPQIIDGHIYGLAWAGPSELYACGHGHVYQCRVDDNIHLTNTFKSRTGDEAWTFIRCIQTAQGPVTVVASSESASIWIPTHDVLIENAHQEPITAIDIRPQPVAQRRSASISGKSQITIASYSVDCTVNVWQVDLDSSKEPERIHRFRLGADIPALAGGFSSDGYALGAVSKDRLFIWDAERGGEPIASWTAPSLDATNETVKEEADQTNGQNGHATPATDRALSWDHDGKKLAFGFGKKVCSTSATSACLEEILTNITADGNCKSSTVTKNAINAM